MPKRVAWEVRAGAYAALAAGMSAEEVASSRGVHPTTVMRWAKMAGMRFLRGRYGGIEQTRPYMHELDPERSYARLTLPQRAVIEASLAVSPSLSFRRIAERIGVNVSTVSREVNANLIEHWDGRYYRADTAQARADGNRARQWPRKLDHPVLRAAVVQGLNNRFSPAQVQGRLKRTFPDRPEMQVSHETIYQALYVQGAGGLRHELTVEKAVRSGRTSRKPKSQLPPRTNRPWLDGARLSERPAEAADRAVPGHWEGDLVVGPENSGIVTLVERASRFTLLGRLPGMRDSATVTEVLAAMIATLPAAFATTITWDQGTEMAQHAAFTVATGIRVFFCDPHSPWQRPTNENTNGLIRDFYPKGTNFNTISDADLGRTQHLLNIRPRAVLAFATPGETLDTQISRVALAT
ncbi:IS30 family transposase [Orlajensenia flava]|uniref:IS30 family transposase n=1 Tax=Orlajensenia flava TaxID=2565934 RepID=UPI003D9C3D6F